VVAVASIKLNVVAGVMTSPPPTDRSPPRYMFPLTPTPPATCNAPVVVDVAAVESCTRSLKVWYAVNPVYVTA
jgi:hypothetical protein